MQTGQQTDRLASGLCCYIGSCISIAHTPQIILCRLTHTHCSHHCVACLKTDLCLQTMPDTCADGAICEGTLIVCSSNRTKHHSDK